MKNFRISKLCKLPHFEEIHLTVCDFFPNVPAVLSAANSKNVSPYRTSLTQTVYQHGNTRNTEMRSPYPKGLNFISFPSLHSHVAHFVSTHLVWWGVKARPTNHPSTDVTVRASEVARRPQTPEPGKEPSMMLSTASYLQATAQLGAKVVA